MNLASRCLVIGATGFVGKHLVPALAADGWEVWVPVVRSRGHAAPGSEIRGVAVDYLDSSGMARLVTESRPEVVFNLAAAGVQRRAETPEELADGNIGLVTRLLHACSVTKPLVLHAGSWSEYADPTDRKLITEDHPRLPRTAYGAAKAAAATAGAELAARLGIAFVVMRLFNVYGPGEAPHRLLPAIVEAVARGTRAALTPGDQERDFVHVADAAAGFVTAAGTADIAASPAYNLCTGRATSVATVARLAAAALGEGSERVELGALPARPDEPPWVVGDPSRFAARTGWRAAIPVESGVADTVTQMMSEHTPA
jgi:nucleoside-diphosphate-sugar epimerase